MVLKKPREKLMIDERNKTLWLCLFKKSLLEKVLSGVKHVRLDMTARDKGAPDKGHTTLFSSSKVVHYFPNFRSYLGMEYEQPWNMGKILLELYIYIHILYYMYIIWRRTYSDTRLIQIVYPHWNIFGWIMMNASQINDSTEGFLR